MNYFEDVIERCGQHILISKVRPATQEEVEEANRLHKLGQCPHTIVRDEQGLLYDHRFCVTCGISLGLI